MKNIEITEELYEKLVELGFLKEEPKFNNPEDSLDDINLFYYIDSSGKVQFREYDKYSCSFKEELIAVGNIFKTKEQAEQEAKETKVRRLLKNFSDANGADKIDWDDPFQEKYYIHYDYDDLSFAISFDYTTKEMTSVYFISKEVAEEALRRYKNELEELMK